MEARKSSRRVDIRSELFKFRPLIKLEHSYKKSLRYPPKGDSSRCLNLSSLSNSAVVGGGYGRIPFLISYTQLERKD